MSATWYSIYFTRAFTPPSHNARRTMTEAATKQCVWHWSKYTAYWNGCVCVCTCMMPKYRMSRSVGMFFTFYSISLMLNDWAVAAGGEVTAAAAAAAVIALCWIDALHMKGKIFPWPLAILDGLILAHRTGELFALVCIEPIFWFMDMALVFFVHVPFWNSIG